MSLYNYKARLVLCESRLLKWSVVVMLFSRRIIVDKLHVAFSTLKCYF